MKKVFCESRKIGCVQVLCEYYCGVDYVILQTVELTS